MVIVIKNRFGSQQKIDTRLERIIPAGKHYLLWDADIILFSTETEYLTIGSRRTDTVDTETLEFTEMPARHGALQWLATSGISFDSFK